MVLYPYYVRVEFPVHSGFDTHMVTVKPVFLLVQMLMT